MIYDSLSLNNGGGIISTTQKSEQSGRASLCIGIGGVGIAALAQLKRKVFQQLEPDDPDSPIPRYQHIQFLAIDSDIAAIDCTKGTAKLTDDEYFSIFMPYLSAILKDNSSILGNPVMSWMEVKPLLSPQGAGSVRQVGRFLLLSKADALRSRIEQKCTAALQGTAPAMDVYVFAGLSGGTGSGCFIDTCYIIRQALQERGLGGKGNIMGFFFLPDVVTSKPEVAANTASVSHNNANGYAALKELDYLMNLQDAQDWFSQDYGSFSIRTQKPPVDVCHLLSAQKADGTLIPNGFGYCVNAAADDVLTCLAGIDNRDHVLTMQEHLSVVTRGVQGLKREYGANLSYHILGIASAEVPLTQISTYLAAGFYRRFENGAGRKNVVITPDDVKTWAGKWGLTAEALEARMMEGCEPLNLPDVDKNVMKAICPVPANKSPGPWWTNGNAWLDQCSGKYTKNREALNGELTSNQVSKVSDGSLLGKVFRELCALAQDPNYGPYYAARLLHSETDDLRTWALGVRAQALEEAVSLDRRLYSVAEAKAQASAELSTANVFNISRRYAAYKQLEESWYTAKNQQNMVRATAMMAGKFADDLADLEKKFFTPLIKVLDDLDDTFRANVEWLNSVAARSQTAYTWRILELEDVKKHLDKVIDALTPKQLVGDFMQEFLDYPDEWLQNDDGKIGLFVSKYMERVFKADVDKGLQDYLFLKYPQAGDNVQGLSKIIKEQILSKVYGDATPMFWCDPKYAVTDPSVTFQSSSLSVPANASAVCTAADQYAKTANNGCDVRNTGLKDRITALRLISGVPLYAYQGVTLLKKDYDEAADLISGVGSHLYAKTDRLTGDNPNIDWRTYLPVPLPYSFKPDLFEKRTTEAQLKLYEEGKQCRAIFLEEPNETHPNTIYQLQLSKPIEIPEYKLEDFLTEGSVLNQKKLSEERERLHHWLEHRYEKAEGAEYFELKNDGNTALHDQEVMERVRRDYFLHYPVLQAKVAEEIKTYQAVKAALARLDELEAEHNHYEADLSSYCDGLFSNVFEVLNANKHSVFDPDENKNIARIQYTYKDSYEVEQVAVFSDTAQPKEYVFAEQYPLYQGFENYRALNPEEDPRHEMEEKVESFRQRSKEEADALTARELEKIYSGERLDELFECIRELEPKERQDLTRFYKGLLRQIKRYKDNFALKVWRNAKASVAYAQTQLRFAAYLYCNNQQLELYSNYKNYAFNRTTNQWVQLPPDTPLYIAKNGQWVLTMTDAQGNVYPQ